MTSYIDMIFEMTSSIQQLGQPYLLIDHDEENTNK
jgi:hypothetical protein